MANVVRHADALRALALLMAGGSGARMRAGGVDRPKPLVEVCGRTLLEWNIRMLDAAGFRRITVSVAAGDSATRAFLDGDARRILRRDTRLTLIEETAPLGNIGAIRLVSADGEPVLVAFADNLAALDLRSLLAHHRSLGAALTIAIHEHTERLPYGEVQADGDWITAYVEKPERRTLVSSGFAVAEPDAVSLVPPERPFGLPDLCRLALERRLPVAAYAHDAPWIDVNDPPAIAEAAALVERERAEFERLLAPQAG